ncbi:hypothetical protein APHAL10511_004956 [Amanita phalloides]|nr:hypothetical protein APHAL10511_004956 [Amanita phalloides]
MDGREPLPYLSTLCTDARNHRARFIRHILSEIDDAGIDRRLNDWTRAIEEGLDDVGCCMSREDWLVGFKRRKEAAIPRQPAKGYALLKGKSDAASASWTNISTNIMTGAAGSTSSDGDEKPHVLVQMQKLAASPDIPSLKPIIHHLVLCVAPFGTQVTGRPEAGGLLSPSSHVSCVFTSALFSAGDAQQNATVSVLYGLDDWESTLSLSEHARLRVVGGTFVLIGATSPSQHRSLIRILRTAIYMHLALILEQHLLSDSNVHLRYSRPKYDAPSSSEPDAVPPTPSNLTPKPRRNSGIRSTLLNLFSRRTFGHRSSTIGSVDEYPHKSELSRNLSIQFPRRSGDESPRSSLDSIGQRIRRFSLRADAHVHPRIKKFIEDPDKPFTTAVARIEDGKDLLSTSYDVSFPPPEVLLDLARYEEDSARRVRGKERRSALTTLLGWDSKDSMGKGMSGTLGFVRHQCISVLVSRHVPQSSSLPARDDDQRAKPLRLACGRPRWETFWYYTKGGSQHDLTLGEVITEFSSVFSNVCDEQGCTSKCGEHQLKFTHGKTCIELSFSAVDDDGQESKDGIVMWESCAVCRVKSTMKEMSDGTYLLSFAKYLELLIYSPAIHSSPICEHTTHPDPNVRINFVRHFSTRTCIVTFCLSEERDIFQLHLPRLQICRTGDKTSHPVYSENCQEPLQMEEEQIVLRRQIRAFWEAVSDHLDRIEGLLTGPDSGIIKKALPRLPSSMDGAYEDYMLAPQASTISTYMTAPDDPGSSLLNSNLVDPVDVRVSRENHVYPGPQAVPDPLILLSAMRYAFQRTEQSLYAQLSRAPTSQLNDFRRSFLAAGRSAQKRVTAWKKKHLEQGQDLVGDMRVPEPEWWDKKIYVLPGGNVVVHEEDWGSVIAFTLSSSDFLNELSNLSVNRSASGQTAFPEATAPSAPSTPSASSAVTTKGYKFFSNASTQQQQPDPDRDDAVWHEPEPYAAVVTRKEVSRDSASILSLRDMLLSRTPAEPGVASPRAAAPLTPPLAWAKPDVQLIKEAVGGEVGRLPDTVETVGKMLQELEAAHSGEVLKPDTASVSSSMSLSSSVQRVKGSVQPSFSSDSSSSVSDATVSMLPSLPPEVPPKEASTSFSSVQGPPTPVTPGRAQGQGQGKNPQTASSSFANTLTNSLNYALRLVSSGQSTPRGLGYSASAHHGLLLAEANVIDEKPHIKYEAMVGKRLKISCIVYYAKQFDLLRKRCGIDDVFVKSLSRSNNWAAEGGKSRSHFWKTSDDRFIIKTLVNAWNVADLNVLQELAPACFRYVESMASKPTVLVKLLGYYTVEVKNQESGANHGRLDLVVMENLFYDRKVDKTFDLKGIQGRKVKPTANDSLDGRRRQTLFDGEWIEGQQKTLMLVRPESKKVLRDAVKSDAEFLAKMNIMDYSLLLGIDVESKHIMCGLVDMIGSYTLAKTLEYKAKHGLHSTKDVTVIPPAEYEERFVNALEGYFVACPDKWSKPLDESWVLNVVDQLPSVL